MTGLCEGNSLVTSEFPTHKASNMENVSLWWRHHGFKIKLDHKSLCDSCNSQTVMPETFCNAKFVAIENEDLCIKTFIYM